MTTSEAEISSGLLVPPAAALGFAASVAVGAVAPVHAWWAVVVLIVGCSLTATIGPVRPALVIGALWALCADGFVAHRYGRLLPAEPGDLAWLAAFVGAAVLGAWCRLPPQLVRRHVDAALRAGASDRPGERTP